MLLPYRRRHRAQPFEQQRDPCECLMGDDQQDIPGHHDRRQRQRHHDEGDHRNRHRVRQRRNNGYLLKEHQHQRYEAERNRALRSECLAPLGSASDSADADVEQQPDSAEREPEAGSQRRPRVPHQDHGQRPQPHHGRAAGPAKPEPDRRDDQHVERSLRRNFEAGQQHIDKRRRHARDGGGLARRQSRGQLVTRLP